MRGNEFEKRVQEEMEELHLRPSDTVWEGVEYELKKKKRRRIAFYLSMLAGLGLLGYMGFSYFSQENTQLATNNQEQQLQTDKSSYNPSTNSTDNIASGQESPASSISSSTDKNTKNSTSTIGSSLHDQASNIPVSNTNGQALYPSATPSKNNINGKMIVRQKAPLIGKAKPNKPKPQQPSPIENSPVAITHTDEPTQPVIDKEKNVTNNTDIATKDPQTDIQAPAIDPVKNDSAIAKVDLKTDLPAATKQDITVAKPKQPKKLNVKIGFEGSIGKNLSRNNSFKIPAKGYLYESFSPVLSDFYDNARANSPTPPQSATNGYAGNLGGGFVRPPSPITAELAFKAGVTAEIRLTKRSSILAGIRYAYLSESLNVGEHGYANNLLVNRWQGPLDAMQNYYVVANGGLVSNPLVYANGGSYTGGYYYGPRSVKYTNKYHFLEVPLSYQWQVINGKKIQLLWNGGVSASVLLNTNALVYDTASFGVYYKNSKAFNKVHFSLNSGISVRFGQENKLQWSIGPEFSMDMTRILSNDFILRNRYFMYGGVTARVMLPRKK